MTALYCIIISPDGKFNKINLTLANFSLTVYTFGYYAANY